MDHPCKSRRSGSYFELHPERQSIFAYWHLRGIAKSKHYFTREQIMRRARLFICVLVTVLGTATNSLVLQPPPVVAQTSPPAAPSLSLELSGTTISVRWSPVSGATHYQLWVWPSGGPWENLGDVTGTSYSHSGRTPGTSYWYQGRSGNGSEWSAWSNRPSISVPPLPTSTPTNTPRPASATSTPTNIPRPATATSTPTNTPQPPAAPSLSLELSGTTISVRWSPVSGATHYQLWVWPSGGPWENLGDVTGTSYSHSGRTPGTSYWYQGRSGNGSEWSAWSNRPSISVPPLPTSTPTNTPRPSSATSTPTDTPQSASATSTPTDTPQPVATLPAPQNFRLDTNSARVNLSWNAVTGASKYQVWKGDGRGEDVQWQDYALGTTTNTSYTDNDVTQGNTYSYAVRAQTDSGNGAWSSSPHTTIPHSAPTGKPVVTLTHHGNAAVRISWTAVDNAEHYLITYHPHGDTTWHEIPRQYSSLSYVHSNLRVGVRYNYAVRAHNSHGHGPWSDFKSESGYITPTGSTSVAETNTPNPQSTATDTPSPTPTNTPPPSAAAHTPTPPPTVIIPARPRLSARVSATHFAVELRWNKVTGADRYEVKAWTPARGFHNIGGNSLHNNSFWQFSEVTHSARYLYQVRGVNRVGDQELVGPWSNWAHATMPAAPTPTPSPTATATNTPRPTPTRIPAPPRMQVKKRAAGSGVVLWWWESSSGLSRNFRYEYELQRALWTSDEYTPLSTRDTPVFVDVDVTANTTYKYRVRVKARSLYVHLPIQTREGPWSFPVYIRAAASTQPPPSDHQTAWTDWLTSQPDIPPEVMTQLSAWVFGTRHPFGSR